MKLASAAQMRELDRQAIQERKIPSIDLMERAAEGVAEAALELLPLTPGEDVYILYGVDGMPLAFRVKARLKEMLTAKEGAR